MLKKETLALIQSKMVTSSTVESDSLALSAPVTGSPWAVPVCDTRISGGKRGSLDRMSMFSLKLHAEKVLIKL